MNGVLGHDSAFVRLCWAGDNLANEMNFVMNHAPGAGSITRPVDQRATTVPRMSPIVCTRTQGRIICSFYLQTSAKHHTRAAETEHYDHQQHAHPKQHC